MNELKKNRVKTVLKYTWPFYIIVAIVVYAVMSVIFRVTHPTPAYKTLTLFVTGEVTDSKKLKDDVFEKYGANNLRTFSCISSSLTDMNYTTKLTVSGYASADILILPESKVSKLNVSSFSIELKDELISDYYQGYSFYKQEEVNYGVKIDKNKVSKYMTLPNEDCYMFLNGRSKNLGEYNVSSKPIKEHNNALNVVKDWGM